LRAAKLFGGRIDELIEAGTASAAVTVYFYFGVHVDFILLSAVMSSAIMQFRCGYWR
jgi:hypothetical protein